MSVIVQIQPNADVSNTNTTITGAASRYACLAKNSVSNSASYVTFTGAHNVAAELIVDMETYTLATNERCAAIRAQMQRKTTGTVATSLYIRYAATSTDYSSLYTTGNYSGWVTSTGNWITSHGGSEWVQADLDAVRMRIRDSGAGTGKPIVDMAYMELDIRTQPTVGISFPYSGAVTDLSFRATWYKGGASESQKFYRVKIFTQAVAEDPSFDVTSSATVYDSGQLNGSYTEQDIPLGYLSYASAYYIYTQNAVDFNGNNWYSEWSSVLFMTTSPPVDTVTAPTGTVTLSTSPAIVVTFTPGNPGDVPYSHYVKLFSAAQYGALGFDPETSTPLWDGGEVIVNALGSDGWTFSVDGLIITRRMDYVLPLTGTFRAYAKSVKSPFNVAGAWAYSQFTMSITPPVAPTITVTPDIINGKVMLEGLAANVTWSPTQPETDYLLFEYSDDGGVTWNPVRDINGLGYWPSAKNKLSHNQQSMETDASGWIGITNCTVAQSSAWANLGTYSLQLTSVAAGVTVAQLNGTFLAKAGYKYTIYMAAKANSTGRTVNLTINWYDANSVFISSSATSAVDNSSTAVSVGTYEATAPVGSFYGVPFISFTGAAGEIHRFDTINVFEKQVVYDYEIPLYTTRYYRVQAVSDDSGSLIGNPSSSVSTSLQTRRTFLTDIVTQFNKRIYISDGYVTFKRNRQKTVHRLIGKTLPIVVSGVNGGQEFTLNLTVEGEIDWNDLITLCESNNPLYLKLPRRSVYMDVAEDFQNDEHLWDELHGEVSIHKVSIPCIEIEKP